jgi:hypothetical protein
MRVGFPAALALVLRVPTEDLFPWLPADEVFTVCSRTLVDAVESTAEGQSAEKSTEMTCLNHLSDAKRRVNADVDAMAVMDECKKFSGWAGATPDPDVLCVQLSEAHAGDKSAGLETYKPSNDQGLSTRFCRGAHELGMTIASCETPAHEATEEAHSDYYTGDPRWSGRVSGDPWGKAALHTAPNCTLGDHDCDYIHDGPL